MAKTVDFWFDYTCPFAYLASTQVRAMGDRMGVAITYCPTLLGGILKALDAPQKLLGPARSAHDQADMQRWARRYGVELRMPAEHPLRSVEALRATLATGIDPAVVDGFYRAYWVENRPISSPEVITEVVRRAGHDPAVVLEKIGTAAIKDELRARTDRSVALGVFGVPTFIVDGTELYWGQDRMHFVELRSEKSAPSRAGGASGAGDLEGAPSPSNERKKLDVYWDFSSPFSYLGASAVETLARRTNVDVVWHPILVGGLFRAIGTPDVPIATFPDAKRRHVLADLDRWAAYRGVPFRFPSRFPMNSLKALRVYLALPEAYRADFRNAAFRAYWAEDRDISDDAVLAACVGHEARARDALCRATSDEVKAQLRSETEAAAAAGVFGVPSFAVDGELYWGQDRLVLVEEALAGR